MKHDDLKTKAIVEKELKPLSQLIENQKQQIIILTADKLALQAEVVILKEQVLKLTTDVAKLTTAK